VVQELQIGGTSAFIAAAASKFFHEKRLLLRGADKALRYRSIADLE
jgi:hypothetical protein